jgi:hypothetical protein
VNPARSRIAPPAWVRVNPTSPQTNHAPTRALAPACAAGGGQLRVLPWTRATRQYVLAEAVAVAVLCDVLVMCSASPACVRPSPSLCRRHVHLANARPTRLSAYARARVLVRLRPTRLVRVCGRTSTPRSPSCDSRNEGTTCRGKNRWTSWSHVTYESVAW